MNRVSVFAAVAFAVSFAGCLKEKDIKLPNNGFVPLQRNDGWATSTPEAENMNRDLLSQAYDLVYNNRRFPLASSLLVIRNGKLVAEAYPRDLGDADRIANIQSCTKSFTSIMTGIAFHDGYFTSVNEKLSDIYPQHFTDYPDKTNITLEDALTMRTGLEYENDEQTLWLYRSDNTVDFVLQREKQYEPGITMDYNDGAPQLVSAAIQQRTGKSLGDYANEKLFAPLGITDWLWEKGKDGVTFGAFSLYLKPRDLAKWGQLLAQHGKWNNEQLVDSAWIANATSLHAMSTGFGAPYGYYFWCSPETKGFCALGHGGQVVYCVPEKNLVMVYTAFPYTNHMFWDEASTLMDLVYHSCQ